MLWAIFVVLAAGGRPSKVILVNVQPITEYSVPLREREHGTVAPVIVSVVATVTAASVRDRSKTVLFQQFVSVRVQTLVPALNVVMYEEREACKHRELWCPGLADLVALSWIEARSSRVLGSGLARIVNVFLTPAVERFGEASLDTHRGSHARVDPGILNHVTNLEDPLVFVVEDLAKAEPVHPINPAKESMVAFVQNNEEEIFNCMNLL